MGVFSKLKNIFYDEEVIEEPEVELKKVDKEVKKSFEMPKVEEVKTVVEEGEEEKPVVNKVESTFNERELFRNERTFSFTELDDEEDTLPSRRNVLSVENRNKPIDNPVSAPQVEQPKVFKPSPVISPIYGILDKDYTREEVVTKKDSSPVKEMDNAVRDYDSVRRKAYGTLEDDLEDTLNSMNTLSSDTILEEEKKVEDDYEEKSNKIEELINKIESNDSSVSVGELEDKLELENFEEDEDEKVDKTMTDSTLEHDLFNLIDSMYDDKEE